MLGGVIGGVTYPITVCVVGLFFVSFSVCLVLKALGFWGGLLRAFFVVICFVGFSISQKGMGSKSCLRAHRIFRFGGTIGFYVLA